MNEEEVKERYRQRYEEIAKLRESDKPTLLDSTLPYIMAGISGAGLVLGSALLAWLIGLDRKEAALPIEITMGIVAAQGILSAFRNHESTIRQKHARTKRLIEQIDEIANWELRRYGTAPVPQDQISEKVQGHS